MKWTLLDTGETRTFSALVPGGTLYKTISYNGGVALCFVPFMVSPLSVPYSAPLQPGWDRVTCNNDAFNETATAQL